MIIYDILLWVNPAKQVIPKARPYQKVRPSHQKGSAYIQEPGSFERHSNTKVVGDQGKYIYIPSSSLTLWKTPPFKHIVS